MERTELPLLRDLIVLNKCKRIVEIGVGDGASTRFLCQGAMQTGGHVWGFDVWHRHGLRRQFTQFSSQAQVTRFLVRSGVPFETFTLTRINTRAEVERFREHIRAECNPIDFCFIDGCHSYVGVCNDFFAIYEYLSVGGIVALHDTFSIDGCREFVLDLKSKYYDGTFDIIDFPYGDLERNTGISILVKRSYHKIDRHMDEVCNVEDRRKAIEAREREWYIAQEQLYADAKTLHKPTIT